MYENIWLATSDEVYCVPGGRKISTQVHLVQAETGEEALSIAQRLHEDGYLFKVEPFADVPPYPQRTGGRVGCGLLLCKGAIAD